MAEDDRDPNWMGNERRAHPPAEFDCPAGSQPCNEWRDWVTESINLADQRYLMQQKAINENTTLTRDTKVLVERINGDLQANGPQISELLEVLKATKTGARTAYWIGSKILWILKQAPWILPLLGILYFWKTGKWPGGE